LLIKNQLLAMVAALLFLACWTFPVQAQNGFQFNELDFDRQGTGQGPETSATSGAGRMLNVPGEQSSDGDNLTGLFSDSPQDTGAVAPPSIQNLPGEPSPVTVPAGQGEARIELANGRSSGRSGSSVGSTSPLRRYTFLTTVPVDDEYVVVMSNKKHRGTDPPDLPRNPKRTNYLLMLDANTMVQGQPILTQSQETQMKRYVTAMNDWRSHPEVNPVNCSSYLSNRPLYHIKCFGALARRNP
jgi:hypothetical protein